MNTLAASTDHRNGSRDREPILVDFDCDHMGIAAALRRAFTAAAHDRSDHDFEELLRQLN
jgi:hypothetical protein